MDKTATRILRELVDQANNRYLYDTFLVGGRSELPAEKKAELVGKLIQGLPQEDREILSGLTSEEIATMMTASIKHPRPEKPITRRRGPVKLSK